MNTPHKVLPVSPTLVRKYRRWHRLVGLSAIFPVVILVLTGMPLEFTDRLKLGSTGVEASWIHRQYGIEAPGTSRVSDDTWQTGEFIFAPPAGRVIRVSGDLRGALRMQGVTVVLLSDELILVPDEAGVPVERSPVPAPTALGVTPDTDLILDTAEGLLISSDLGASWHPADLLRLSVTWQPLSAAATPPRVAQRYGAAHVSLERFLLDLHSGRFFGTAGIVIMNLAGILMLVLVFTGFVVWWRSSRSQGG